MCAEVIRDGTGSSFDAKVDIANRLFVTGSITSMPAVSVTAGSESFLYAKSGTGWFPLSAKSGTEMLLKTDASVSVSTGSEVWVQNVSSPDTGSKGGITSGVDTLLIEHSINTGSMFNLTGFDSTGTADGKFSLKENASLISQYRTNAAQQGIIRNFAHPIAFTGGGSVLLFVEHGEVLSQGFQGAIYGYETT